MAAISAERWQRARKLPLVSLGLVAVVLMAFLAIKVGFSARLDAAHLEIAEAIDYAIQNPVVEVPERLLPAIRAVLPTFESNEMFSFLKDGKGKRAGATHQATFDQLVQVALARLDSHPYRSLAVIPARPWATDFLTYPAVHTSWVQLLLVVALLLVLGPLMERTWGHGVFAGMLVTTAVVGAGAFSLVHAGADRPLLGAGPLLLGLSAAVATRFPRGEVDVLAWLSPVASVEMSLPTWLLAALGVVGVGLGTGLMPGALPGGLDAAYGVAALVSGAGVGALAAFGLARSGLEARFGEAPPVERTPQRAQLSRFDFAKVVALRTAGETDAAFEMLAAEVERSARNRDAVMTFFEMAVERGAVDRAVPYLQQLVNEEMRRGAVEVAVSHWRTLSESAPGARLEPALILRLIPVIRQEDGDEQALVAVQQALDLADRGLTTPLALDLARLASDLDADFAVEAARIALASDQLRRENRQELEDMVERLIQKEDEVPVFAPKALPANPFFEEQDRSGFGVAGGDLAEITDPAYLKTIGHPAYTPAASPTLLAKPLGLDSEALAVEVEGRGALRLPFARIRAIGSVGVRGLGTRPVVVTDVVMESSQAGADTLQVVRFRSDRYDPRRLAPAAGSALDALQTFVAEVARRASAESLVPAELAGAGPIAIFESLEAYEAQLLQPLLARRSAG